MKKALLLLSAALLTAAGQAQTPVTVSTHAGNADQVWYSLQNGEVGRAPLSEWDLAFEMTGFSSSIRVNTAKGLVVYETPVAIADWDGLDSADVANWTRVDNSDSSWSVSALNHGNNLADPDGFNVGWGDYNIATHVIVGSKIYAISFPDATWKKLRINYLANGIYSFTYSNLDGNDLYDEELVKTDFTGKNFGYWSFTTNSTLDREPPTLNWDLLFTKYTGFVPTPYGVSGVLQNKNVKALQVNAVPNADADWNSAPFSANMNILGSDWKRYDFDLNQYSVVTDTTYFVKDIPGNIWKIVFTGYGGGATGDMSFNQELVSSVGIGEIAHHQGTLITYPNPVTNGQARMIVDVPAREGMLRIFNTTGQQMAQQQWSGLSGLTTRTLDVSGLAKGVYMLRFDAANSTSTGKLVIE
ncbi:MAG: T9SS type A sorting domain-containing protein [Flavobacteriales bacterium]